MISTESASAINLDAMKAWGLLQERPDAPLRAIFIEPAESADLCKVCTSSDGAKLPACAYALCTADIAANKAISAPKLFDLGAGESSSGAGPQRLVSGAGPHRVNPRGHGLDALACQWQHQRS